MLCTGFTYNKTQETIFLTENVLQGVQSSDKKQRRRLLRKLLFVIKVLNHLSFHY